MRTADVACEGDHVVRGRHILVRAAEHCGGDVDDRVARVMVLSAAATIASAAGWIAMAGAHAGSAASIAALAVEVGASAPVHVPLAPAPTSINSLLGKLVRPISRLAATMVAMAA